MGKASILLVIGYCSLLLMSGIMMSDMSVDAYDNALNYYEGIVGRNIAVAGANMAANYIFLYPPLVERQRLVFRIRHAGAIRRGELRGDGGLDEQRGSQHGRSAPHTDIDRDLSRQHHHRDGDTPPEQLCKVCGVCGNVRSPTCTGPPTIPFSVPSTFRAL